jgi:N-acyl homoserine lactone hydrolase
MLPFYRSAARQRPGQALSCDDGAMASITVRRVDLGYFVRPAEETGTGAPRVEPCLGYVVDHPAGRLLFDTGMGSDPEVDAHYRPRRVELVEALAAIGAKIADLRLAANSHLHFDHCGGNPELGQLPVFVQAAELSSAQETPDYTLPGLIDSSRFEQVSGQAEVLPGVTLMPTPTPLVTSRWWSAGRMGW